MNLNTKILIIGFGSIGQRHYGNLLKLGYKNVFVYDIDPRKIPRRVKKINSLSVKELGDFKISFVCNPTSLHIKTALLAAKAKNHLFIEKPLSSNLKGAKELVALCRKNELITMVACNLRFDPCLQRLKELLDKGFLGKVFALHSEYGNYLPYQRKGRDYRKTYAARKEKGGGIILDDIHSFDLLFWLNNFKALKNIQLCYDKVSRLAIDTEDISVAVLRFGNKVIGSIRSDYLQQRKSRSLKVIGEKGNFVWDFREGALYFEDRFLRKKIFQPKFQDQNKMYIDEIKYFLKKTEEESNTFNDLEKSLIVLKTVLNSK
ncbi:MAG: Gfo/Idh/MocA family oxidoreductase [Candidatus Nealsonbacteria bacterium]|nr:Gfo/Idh/MocA family oxidoreductase [Candidatus Nealsonbacteria bacterium]